MNGTVKAARNRAWKICVLCCLLAAIFLVWPGGPVQAATNSSGHDIRVLIATSSSAREYRVQVESGSYQIRDENGRRYGTLNGNTDVRFFYDGSRYNLAWDGNSVSSDTPLTILPDSAKSRFSYQGTAYRGGFRLMMNGNYCYGVNVVDLELYLYGVVGREIGYGYPIEALKAQAVASRSYALANIKSSNVYYDVTATTSSQVYGGYKAETDRVIEAVDGTRGYVLLYQGKVVPAFFSSNAGGHTENLENIWGSNDGFPMVGVPSPYDKNAGNYGSYGAACYEWRVEFTPADLVRLANSYGKTDIGSYVGISWSQSYDGSTSVSGRTLSFTIRGTKGSVTATRNNVCALLNLKSNRITVTDGSGEAVAGYVLGSSGVPQALQDFRALYAIGGALATMLANGNNDSFYVRSASGVQEVSKDGTGAGSGGIVITGYGFGHGAGMSQWGAIAMADDGYSWDEIIEHYYCSGGIRLSEYY